MGTNNNFPVKANCVSSFLADVKIVAKKSNEFKNKIAEIPKNTDKQRVGTSIIGRSTRITKDISLSTGYRGYFKSGSTLNQEVHLFEFMLPITIQTNNDDNLVKSATYASGFRVVFHVTDIKTELEVGFAGFAAQAELGLANIRVLFEIFGLGDTKLKGDNIDLADLFLFNKFDVKSYSEIIKTQRALVNFFQNNTSGLIPELVSVEIDPNIEFTNEDRQSRAFAYAQILADNTLEEAIKTAQDRDDLSIDENILVKIYHKIIEDKPLKDDEIEVAKTNLGTKNIRPSHKRRARKLLERL